MAASLLAEPKSRCAAAPPKPASPAKVRVWILIGIAALVALAAWKIQSFFVGLNLHVVVPDLIYRGAQPSTQELEALIDEHGIRTVINLRGCGNPFEWYLEQSAVVQRHGLAQEDICFSAGRLPSAHEVQRLVEVLDHTEYPVYLHCRRGSDRTGLAAAVALLLMSDRTFAEARAQLSLRYGHFNVGRPGYLDEFLNLYEAALSRKRQPHAPENFRQWLANDYRGGWCSYQIERFERSSPPLTKGGPGGVATDSLVYNVRYRNTGDRPWQFRASPTGGIHAGYLVHDDQGREITRGRGGFLDREVAPGEAIDITLVVAPITKPGRYRLLVDLIEEGHCWFYQTGTEPREEEIIIRE